MDRVSIVLLNVCSPEVLFSCKQEENIERALN